MVAVPDLSRKQWQFMRMMLDMLPDGFWQGQGRSVLETLVKVWHCHCTVAVS